MYLTRLVRFTLLSWMVARFGAGFVRRTGFFKPLHIKRDATYMARASLKILALLNGQYVAAPTSCEDR